MSKKESFGIITILAVFMAVVLSIWAIRTLNKSDAEYVLYMLKYYDAPNEYITEVKDWKKSYSNSHITEHFTLYETLNENKKHSKYVVVISDDSSNTKSAFVVSNIDNIDDTSKRVTHAMFAPVVKL